MELFGGFDSEGAKYKGRVLTTHINVSIPPPVLAIRTAALCFSSIPESALKPLHHHAAFFIALHIFFPIPSPISCWNHFLLSSLSCDEYVRTRGQDRTGQQTFFFWHFPHRHRSFATWRIHRSTSHICSSLQQQQQQQAHTPTYCSHTHAHRWS